MGWEDIEEIPTSNLREQLLSLLDKEAEYSLPLPQPRALVRDRDESTTPPRDGAVGDCISDCHANDGEEEGEDPAEEIRRNVCQWNYECADYFLIDREVVYLSMHYFDRYLAHEEADEANGQGSSQRNGRQQQRRQPNLALSHLLALSSLYVACKLHGVSTQPPPSSDSSSSSPVPRPARLRLRDFYTMSRGTYCVEMIEEMELSLLTNLGWKLHPPTPTDRKSVV